MRHYRIRIAVSTTGICAIGQYGVKRLGKVADSELVYGSQLPHRVAAKDSRGKWRITTPTHARKMGWKSIRKVW